MKMFRLERLGRKRDHKGGKAMAKTGFLKRIWNKVIGSDDSAKKLSQSGVVNPKSFQLPWGRTFNRKGVFDDIARMDDGDGMIARALDSMADFGCAWPDENIFGFKVELNIHDDDDVSQERTNALNLINTMSSQSNLQGSTWEVMRFMLKAADCFAEMVVDNTYNVRKIRILPAPYQIERNENKYGSLNRGDPVAAVKDPSLANTAAYTQYDDNGNIIAAFWPWQIIHWSFGRSEGNAYHKPLLAPVITQWKRLHAQEDSLAIARLIRAWESRVHKIPVALGSNTEETVEKLKEYRQAMEKDRITTFDTDNEIFNQSSRENPVDVDTDFYIARFYNEEGKYVDGEIDNLQSGTAALQNIDDIQWGLNRVVSGIGLPMGYMNVRTSGERSFVDKTPEERKEAFARMVSRLQWLHALGCKQVIDFQLFAHGYNPVAVDYIIAYPPFLPRSVEIDSKMTFTNTQSAAVWRSMGIPDEIIGQELLGLDPVEIKKWLVNPDKSDDDEGNDDENDE